MKHKEVLRRLQNMKPENLEKQTDPTYMEGFNDCRRKAIGLIKQPHE